MAFIDGTNITSDSQFFTCFQLSILTPGSPEMRSHWVLLKRDVPGLKRRVPNKKLPPFHFQKSLYLP